MTCSSYRAFVRSDFADEPEWADGVEEPIINFPRLVSPARQNLAAAGACFANFPKLLAGFAIRLDLQDTGTPGNIKTRPKVLGTHIQLTRAHAGAAPQEEVAIKQALQVTNQMDS